MNLMHFHSVLGSIVPHLVVLHDPAPVYECFVPYSLQAGNQEFECAC
jgi:hypothetical protein